MDRVKEGEKSRGAEWEQPLAFGNTVQAERSGKCYASIGREVKTGIDHHRSLKKKEEKEKR